jgi:K+-sensing histidine kinase KdpD
VAAPAWRSWRRRSRRALVIVGAPVLAVAALVPLREHVRNTNLALVLVLVVLAGAAMGGRLVGVIVGVAVATAFDFFLTRPFESFTIDRADDVQTTILLAAVGLIGGELVERARRSQAEADARRREVEQFQRRAELAAWGERPGRLISRTEEELSELLGLVEVSYRAGPPPRELSVLTHNGVRVPGGQVSLGDDVVALPVRAHGRDLGHFLLVFPRATVGVSVSSDRRHSAIATADQLGMALLRYQHG